jgi:hypothetical protein
MMRRRAVSVAIGLWCLVVPGILVAGTFTGCSERALLIPWGLGFAAHLLVSFRLCRVRSDSLRQVGLCGAIASGGAGLLILAFTAAVGAPGVFGAWWLWAAAAVATIHVGVAIYIFLVFRTGRFP